MKKRRVKRLAVVAGCVFLSSPSALCADPLTPLPGTIAHALQFLPDGSAVALPGVFITKTAVRPPYMVVREPWPDENRLIVLLPGPLDVSLWQTVDVSGVMTTLVNGYRAVTYVQVLAHQDAWGNVIRFPAPFKFLDASEGPFAWRKDLTEEAAMMMAESGSMIELMDEGPPPSPDPDTPGNVELDGPAEGSVQEAKTSPDSTEVTLTDKIVSRSFSSAGYFYIQEPSPERAGVRVAMSSPNYSPGQILSVAGTMGTVGGERVIQSPDIDEGSTTTISPTTLIGRSFPCGPLHIDDQDPNTVDALGATDGVGAHHIGTLVKTAGRITAKGTGYFYVWDGSLTFGGGVLTDDTNNDGVRVETPEGDASVDVNHYVSVVGISGLRAVGDPAVYYPVIRAKAADVTTECSSRMLEARYEQPFYEMYPGYLLFTPCDTYRAITFVYSFCGVPYANANITVDTHNGDDAKLALSPATQLPGQTP